MSDEIAEASYVARRQRRPGRSELAAVEREAKQELRSIQLRVWLTRALGAGLGAVLVAWALMAPGLSDRDQTIIGLLLAVEVTALGFALAVYDRRTHVRTVERYLERLSELAERLQETSERDPLTGLHNRSYLLDRLGAEISLAERHQRPLSVVILDLDEFKSVNDTHGHLVGDEVLQLVSATIGEQVRQHDTFARYGGDEFCLVLPESDCAAAEAVAQKLRRAVEELAPRLEALAGSAIGLGYGVAGYGEDGTTVRELIAAADKQLYERKQARQDEQAEARSEERGASIRALRGDTAPYKA